MLSFLFIFSLSLLPFFCIIRSRRSKKNAYDATKKLEAETRPVTTKTSTIPDLAVTASLTDEELVRIYTLNNSSTHNLESILGNLERAVLLRRAILFEPSKLKDLPFAGLDYLRVHGSCCENVVGYVPVPIGIAGPFFVDGISCHLPLATTEGALVASTNRGCKALRLAGNVITEIIADGMTRAPVVRMPSIVESARLKRWVESDRGLARLQQEFKTTSRYGRLIEIRVILAGRLAFLRFKAQCGDAMGMNMVSKGVEHCLAWLKTNEFANMEIMALSGNVCADKKLTAINWIEGRGKSVIAEAVIPGKIVASVLHAEVGAVCEIANAKNLIGSAMGAAIGGQNAHAANIIAALFVACGQDLAQVVESAACITLMEPANGGMDLRISCTMPCIEVGTIGGGTILPAQQACLNLMNVAGPNQPNPGANADRLARIVGAAVLAGELSIMAALSTGTLVKSHLSYNRPRDPLSS